MASSTHLFSFVMNYRYRKEVTRPPVLSHTSPSPFYPPYPPFSKHGHCEPSPFCDIIEGKRIC